MSRSIVFPLDADADADELLAKLHELGFEDAIVVNAWADVRPFAPIDHDGERLDAPRLDVETLRELRSVRDRAAEVGLDRFRVDRPAPFRDHAEEIGYVRAVELLRIASSAIAGRDGWRRTADGREWFSSDWLGLAV